MITPIVLPPHAPLGPINLRPFFSFYGGKWRVAKRYPPPRHDTIIEPFAGSAGYSLRYPDRQVILVERNPHIVATWRYLIGVSPEEIRALPDLPVGQTVQDLPICEEARLLVGWWLTRGGQCPNQSHSAWARDPQFHRQFWGPVARDRIARQVEHIRHWKIIEGDYTNAPDIAADWFIDPPYQKAGKYYRFGSDSLDFSALATWCRSRCGQVMVCENTGTRRPLRPRTARPTRWAAAATR